MHTFWLTFISFLHMGGYARFIWPAYSFTLIVIVLSLYSPWRKRKQLLKK